VLAEERRSKIQELLAHRSSVTIANLVEAFGTSEMTVRRDLDELEARGVCQRIYGGAISLRINEYRTTNSATYPPYSLREQSCVREKIAIARRAAALVQPGDTIAIDSGTTAAHLAYALRNTGSITVISNSIGVLAQLYDITSISLISPGGTLSLEGSFAAGGDMSFVGPITAANLRGFRPNKAFIGASGLSAADGISNAGLFQAEIKRVIIETAEEVVLITDHSKFGQVSGFIVSGIQSFHKIITDIEAPANEVEELRARGIDVILVEPAQDAVTLRPALFTTISVLAEPNRVRADGSLSVPVGGRL
jgi:DeoR/GlpR family transcriptional regulator of sugar metabolism